MPKPRIDKTIIILDANEVREILHLARGNDPRAIAEFMRRVIARKVDLALRSRCK
ncbi:MAG: hypothetical protein ACUVWB_04050 [Anaerolineae bacterium]